MIKTILILFSVFSFQAFAGGIAFNRPLTGTNPLTGRALVFEARGGLSETAVVPFTLNGQSGTLKMISRNADGDIGETILSVTVGGETMRAVLSGDCQIVESMILILPSGAHISLNAQ